MSCIAAYHVDFVKSERPAACEFAHTLGQEIPGYLRAISSSMVLLPVLNIVSNAP